MRLIQHPKLIIAMLATTMLILIYCSDINSDSTYHDVLHSMCGKRAQQLAAASIMCTCFGINVTFLIIIGDQYDRSMSRIISGLEISHCPVQQYSPLTSGHSSVISGIFTATSPYLRQPSSAFGQCAITSALTS